MVKSEMVKLNPLRKVCKKCSQSIYPPLSLEKGGERRYYANSKIYSILPVQSAPLPAGREGPGVGRFT